jgi:hypothetical protein
MSAIAKIAKNRKIYRCESCDYSTCNLFDFNKHTHTKKHSQSGLSMAIDNFSIACDKKSQKKEFICANCNKVYKDNSGLWRHKKRCDPSDNTYDDKYTEATHQITPELVLSVLKQNNELTNLVVEQNKTIIELAKNGTGQNINMQNVNNNNKTFNLNVFLNETCKDAMNIMDFVDSLQLQVSDLENVGNLGFVEGISNIIVKNLQALDVHKRPVHCADKKREVIYIKDEDKWERESEEKHKMRKVIKKVAYKNQSLLPKYKLEHPGCNFSESKYADHYSKLVIEAMRDDDVDKQDKIIRNIAKEVVIDKKEYT